MMAVGWEQGRTLLNRLKPGGSSVPATLKGTSEFLLSLTPKEYMDILQKVNSKKNDSMACL